MCFLFNFLGHPPIFFLFPAFLPVQLPEGEQIYLFRLFLSNSLLGLFANLVCRRRLDSLSLFQFQSFHLFLWADVSYDRKVF